MRSQSFVFIMLFLLGLVSIAWFVFSLFNSQFLDLIFHLKLSWLLESLTSLCPSAALSNIIHLQHFLW